MEHPPTATHAAHLITGEFAPVFWEPLGRRGERLVAGVIVGSADGFFKAYPTLQHRQLLQYLSELKTDSAVGVVKFAFEHFNKTLDAGGTIDDLKAPFARMAIGPAEAISARNDDELVQRAIALCTQLGQMPQASEREPANTSARTRAFVRDVRQIVRRISPKLARTAMKADQQYPIGQSSIRLHFHLNRHYGQFCSLPLPNARPEAATECQARLMDLLTIRQHDSKANVMLWINTITQAQTAGYLGRTNATQLVRQRTLDMAKTHHIPVKEFGNAGEAARAIQEAAKAAA